MKLWPTNLLACKKVKNLRKVLVCEEFIFGIRKIQSCLEWLVCYHLIKTVSLKITAFPSLLWWLRNPEANLQHSQFVHIFITKSVCINLNLILLNYFYYIFSSSICLLYSMYLFVKCLEYVQCWDTNNSTNPSQYTSSNKAPSWKAFPDFLGWEGACLLSLASLTHFHNASVCSVTQHNTMYFNYSYSHFSFPGDYKHFERDSIPSI